MRPIRGMSLRPNIQVRFPPDLEEWMRETADTWHAGNLSDLVRRLVELGIPPYRQLLKDRLESELSKD